VVKPNIDHAPRVKTSRGKEAVECAARAGLILDDWQQHALERTLKVRKNRKWASFENGVDVARQNGKGGIIEAIELANLFAFDAQLTLYTAHLTDTCLEMFWRLLDLIESCPEYDQQVKHVSKTNGREQIKLKSGQRIRFRTRTKGGGRGFTADDVIFDEAMFLPEVAVGSMMPTLSARPNPHVWYFGSAVDQLIHDHGSAFARVRRRGIAKDKGLAYLEWSAPGEIDALDAVLDDPKAWQQANPALGIRIAKTHVAAERRAMDARTFAVERLGIGDWPADHEADAPIDFAAWHALTDNDSEMEDPICLAFDVVPSRERAVIMAAGKRRDGLLHLEKVDQRRGTGWLPERIAELARSHALASISCDPASPAAALIRPLENLGLTVELIAAREYAQACGALFDLVEEKGLRHLGQDELSVAVKNASTRPLGDAWAWSRRASSGDISPLVAGTIALWQASSQLGSVYDERGLIAV